MKRNVLWLGVAVALATGCAQTETGTTPADALLQNESFVAIDRGAPPTAGMIRERLGVNASVTGVSGAQTNDFYLAINKKEFGQRWFISGFLKQYYPGTGTPADLAVRSLGTRVVSFKVQNGKLFVFDVADGKASSDIFDPQVLVEAYPLVSDYAPFNAMANHDQYVLFDPSAGLNKFQVADDLYSDSYLGGSSGPNFQVGLSFMQNFRKISDGVTYEQVFSGNGLYDDGTGHLVSYHTSGSVGLALRKYNEGKGFTSTPYPQTGNFFFSSDWQLVANTGGATHSAIHWNIQKGMKPIPYYITPEIQVFDKMYPNAHITDAVKEGIENWNAIFGFKVLEARLAGPDDDIGQDDKNFIIVDPDPSAGYAFANWSSNPNTGEIRRATVYLGGTWFSSNPFAPTPPPSSGTSLTPDVKPAAKPKLVGMAFSPLKADPACVLWAPKYQMQYRAEEADAGTGATGGTTAPALTPDQQFHNFITHVVLHEVGHTLGLRHNFKGSLVPPSSSVMDYLTNDDSVLRSMPGDYDKQAIAYLYGTTDKEPDMPFCTDDGVTQDPDCAMFDHGADPLTEDHGKVYTRLVGLEFKYGWGANPILDWVIGYYLNDVLGYAVAGADADTAVKAYGIAMGADAAKAAVGKPTYAQTVDGLTHMVLARLYLDPPAARGYIADLPSYPEVNDAALADLAKSLGNADGTFSFETRRAAVDILKLFQSNDAYAALRSARATIAAARASLSADQQALTDDLLARIDRATSPYFNN